MSNPIPVDLVSADGSVVPAMIHVSSIPTFNVWRNYTVRVEWSGGEAAGTGGDAFDALRAVREQLDAAGWVPRCFGASRNFVMSPMGSQTGGYLGYLVQLGQPANAAAGTFETGPNMDLVSVAEQQAFKDAWFESLGLNLTKRERAHQGLIRAHQERAAWLAELNARRSRMSSPPPLLLLPGMAADARIFQDQLTRFPNLRVPSWIPPQRNESLREYAKRFARTIDPGEPCIIGGASFGGIVALEVAAHLQAVACVLIGSIRSPAELSWRWRAMRPLAILGPDGLRIAARIAARIPGLKRNTVRGLERLARPEAAFVRWAMCAVLRWQPSDATQRVPIFQIHGELDSTLPACRSRADEIVPGGSHALSLFNPSAVNAYLERVLKATQKQLPEEMR